MELLETEILYSSILFFWLKSCLSFCLLILTLLSFSFGNSTFFLVGPIEQAKKFVNFKHVPEAIIRISAAVVVVLAIILAIVCGVLVSNRDSDANSL